MTQKTRTFVIGAVAVLVLGLGGGLIAYLQYARGASLPDGVAEEIRCVPADAEVVAFADVRRFMDSDLHRELMPKTEAGPHRGRRMMHDMAGVDLETQVNRVMVFAESLPGTPPAPGAGPELPRAMVLVRGTFDDARIQQAIRDKEGVIETYNGHAIASHKRGDEEVAVGFLTPGLLALGHGALVRRAIDRAAGSRGGDDLTSNAEMMALVRDASGSTAWAVGRFDAMARGLRLPPHIGGQVPPLKLISAKADINGGVKASIRAEAGDQAAADQLRDVLRGFITLARVGSADNPGLQNTLKSVELSGTGATVQIAFSISADTIRAVAPKPRFPEAPPAPEGVPVPPNTTPAPKAP